jgi:hypothetical protein
MCWTIGVPGNSRNLRVSEMHGSISEVVSSACGHAGQARWMTLDNLSHG